MNKNFIAMIGAVSICVPAAANADVAQTGSEATTDPSELAEAKAIIEIMFPAAQRQQLMDKMVADITVPMRQSMPTNNLGDPGLQALVDSMLDEMQAKQRPLMQKHMPALLEAMAAAYSHEFTLAELKDVHDFAQSPSGRHYLSRSSAMLGDPEISKVNAAMFAESQELTQSMIIGFKEKIVAYLKEHPDVAEKFAAQSKAK